MELLDNLKKKQDEEFDNMLEGYLALTDRERMICKPRKKIKSFIDKVRSEIAEAVAREEKRRIVNLMGGRVLDICECDKKICSSCERLMMLIDELGE